MELVEYVGQLWALVFVIMKIQFLLLWCVLLAWLTQPTAVLAVRVLLCSAGGAQSNTVTIGRPEHNIEKHCLCSLSQRT